MDGLPVQLFLARKQVCHGRVDGIRGKGVTLLVEQYVFLFLPVIINAWFTAANSHTTTNTRRHLVHLCLIEPGGTKTNYATSSLKHMAERHPAYADPSYPTNLMFSYMLKEENRSAWAEPSELAETIYLVISRGQRIPIRVPLGSDAWGMIMKDLADTKKDLDELKDISIGVGDAKQLESINFLK